MKAASTERDQASLIPKNVKWIQDAAEGVDPDEHLVHLAGGDSVGYDALVVCPGIQLDIDQIPGLADTLGHRGVSTNYQFELAPKVWDHIRETTSGTAVFTMPSGPIKCAGAPQKIAYLAADYWRRQGVLDDIPDIPEFTLYDLQKTVEAISGRLLHKQNFRRLVEKGGLVEPTGNVSTETGGRPAKLYRFRREVILERPAPGLRVSASRG